MLEGQVQTIYSEQAPTRPRLLTPGGSVSIGGAVETAISVADVLRFGYIALLETICTVTSLTVGTWTFRNGLTGTTLLILQQPVALESPGQRYIWTFPVPWKTAAIGGQFTIQNSVATMGTWAWHINGFMSSV